MSTEERIQRALTLSGVVPPVAMPFDGDSRLVRSAIAEQIDFIVEAGVGGLVAGGSTGEGHTLSDAEFVDAMQAASEATRGRVPFVAGLIVNSTRQAIERTRMLDGLEIAALQVTPVFYLFKPDADATVAHFREIWEQTGVPILIYNVIPWNYLDIALMQRVMAEVPGVVGIKQSSGDLKSLSDLMLSAPPDKRFFSGIDALLWQSFSLGAHGAISALTSAVPFATVRLWKMVQAGEHDAARDLHFRLNALWNACSHDNLPACVKYIQHLQGLHLHGPRAPMQPVGDAQKKAIDPALRRVLEVR
ncbi:MAG: dihydrodipicolinate synthase family protein [Burkholderiaceae bacterium]|nr:dihydrodipicolinate synthase family protein [Burkholderiaceae bacterium]